MKEKIKLIIMIALFIGIILGINYYINYKSKEKIFNIKDSTEKAIVEFTQETVNDNNKNNEYYEMAKANVSKNKVENIIENKIEDLAENIISNNTENVIENNISINTINEIVYANENTFDEEVYKEERIVIVDFYADWCSPCKMLTPILESIAEERKDIKIVKINVDDNSKLANEFRAYSIPLLVIFEDGKEVNRVAGLRSKEFILDLVDKEVE